MLHSKNEDQDAASQGIIDVDLAIASVAPVHQEEAGKINRHQHMSAQIGPIPVQTVDKKQYNACRGKNDMQDEESCELLKGTDYQLRTGAKRGGIREDIREPLSRIPADPWT